VKRPLLAVLLALSLPAAAGDLSSLGSLDQGQFRRLSEDLGATLSYKGVTPATPLGLAGFDIGLEVSATDIRHADLFRLAGSGSPDFITVPKLHAYKGLPFGIDVGAFLGAASDVGATVFGLDTRYALVADGLALPAVALRVSGTRTAGMGALKVSTIAGDLMISKKLTIATPYAGVGLVRTISEAGGAGLADEDFRSSRLFAGLNVNFALLNLAIEAERLGSNTTLSAKAGWRF